MSDEVTRKLGRPRSQPPRLRKCPRCGKLGYPVDFVVTGNTKDGPKRYVYKRFIHYDRKKFKQKEGGRGSHVMICYLVKKKPLKESSGKEHD